MKQTFPYFKNTCLLFIFINYSQYRFINHNYNFHWEHLVSKAFHNRHATPLKYDNYNWQKKHYIPLAAQFTKEILYNRTGLKLRRLTLSTYT